MNKFSDNGFFTENKKVFKLLGGEKRLIVLLKTCHIPILLDIDGVEFDMENTNNLLNANIIKYVIENYTRDLKELEVEPFRIRQVWEGLDLYAVNISCLWSFESYDGWLDVMYYDSIDPETNQLLIET